MSEQYKHKAITDLTLKAFYKVYSTLGYGFLEKVYENAMMVELRQRRLQVAQQMPIDVHYKEALVGHYVADLVVEGKVLVGLKAEKGYNRRHEAQLLHYLKATGMKVGLLINFGEQKCEYKRISYGATTRRLLKANQMEI